MSAPDGIPNDLWERWSAHYRELERIVDELNARQAERTAPDLVYHYTDAAGLLGILQSGKVRMTDIFGLNDPSELRHGIGFAAAVLRDQTREEHPAVRRVTAHFSETMHANLGEFGHFFVACFSRDGDDLGQWRAYGANGNGFALGFDGPRLEKLFAAQRSNNTTIDIIYDDDQLKQVTEQMARIAVQAYGLPVGRRLDDAVLPRFLTAISTGFSYELLRAALLYKHEAYRNEREYRFLHFRGRDDDMSDVQVRVRGSTLVRFIDFDWKSEGRDLLKSIVIGPAANIAEAHQSIKHCLAPFRLDKGAVQIGGSGIPYRG